MTAVALSVAAELTQNKSETPSAAPGGFDIAILILVCVAVIAAAYYTTRFLARRAGGGGKSRYMQVLDKLAISNDKQIFIIKAGGKTHMVGVTGQSISHLAELDEEAMDFVEEPAPQTPKVMVDFADRLKASMPFGGGAAQAKEKRQQQPEPAEEKPIKSGLDTLDEMVSRRKSRFQTALDEAEAQPEQAAEPPESTQQDEDAL